MDFIAFAACAERYIASHKAGWYNSKHAAQWPATLTTYVSRSSRGCGRTARAIISFPGGKAGRPISNMAMLMLLRRMGRADLTARGFRSSFRHGAAERTGIPAKVAEMALAHTVSDKVETAAATYSRSGGS